MGILQREVFYFLAFLVEKKVATGFLRDVDSEVVHGLFSFLLGVGFKQVSSLHGLTLYSLGDKWSLGVNRGP